ncbi:MAG: hypothetical protein ACOC9W_01845 [Persicimonas sp.]
MSNRVIDFKRDEWHTREKLAELLDISVRTLYRRIDDGEIEVKDTPDGKRYRVAPQAEEQEDATVATDVSDDKIASWLHDALQQEHGRRLELEELNAGLRNQLDELTGMRAKYHLERGRREQAELERDELRDRLHALQCELDALSHKLDDEQQRRLRLALGSLSLEIRKS